MGIYYGYTCTTSVQYDRNDKEARKKTKQYQLLVSKCREQNIELNEIYTDLLSDFYRSREELIALCKKVTYEDVIVIDSIFALGTNLYDINDNIMLVHGSCHLKVLSEYKGIDFSTTNPNEDDLLIINDKLQQFATLLGGAEATTLLPFANYQGRPAIPLTEDFKEVYWMYENFFIDEKTAINNVKFKMAKNSFHAKCRLYELTDSYKTDLAKQHELYQTADKPKRSGKLPDWFTTQFIEQAEADTESLTELCMKHNIFPINLQEYNRWKVKFMVQRKGLYEASKQFQNKDLMDSLKKTEEDG